MRLMGSPGVFFAEGNNLIVEADVLRGPLDDHDVVHLPCICLPRSTRGSSRRRSCNDSSDFSNGSQLVVFSLFLLGWRFCWSGIGRTANILLQLTLSDECLHLFL